MPKTRTRNYQPTRTLPGKELKDQELRDAALKLVREQGWEYEYIGTRKPKLTNPAGDSTSLPLTPSSYGSVIRTLATLRRLGADLDEEAALRRRLRSKVRTPLSDEGVVETPWTEKQWRELQQKAGGWRAALYAEPLPEPPPITPLTAYQAEVHERLTAPQVRSDATGNGQWTLREARQMLVDGYSLDRVIARTGWGKMWLEDLVQRLATG